MDHIVFPELLQPLGQLDQEVAGRALRHAAVAPYVMPQVAARAVLKDDVDAAAILRCACMGCVGGERDAEGKPGSG